MRILFDQGVPAPLRFHLPGHSIDTAYERGWSELKNGQLLDAAERDGYQVLMTTDQNLKHQQNLAVRPLAVVVLLSTAWPRIQLCIKEITAAVEAVAPGVYIEVPV